MELVEKEKTAAPAKKPRKKRSSSAKKTKPSTSSVKPASKVKNKRGRPTKYNELMQERAEEYCEGGWKTQEDDAFPSHIGLGFYLGVNNSTLYEWASNHPRFSKTLAKINQKQQQIGWGKGLRGEYNANLVKLLLSTHGIHERSDKDLARDVAEQIKTEFHIHPVSRN